MPPVPWKEELKSKGEGHISVHINGSDETIVLILRTIISVNQLSAYGAVADLCKELATRRNENLESMVIPTEFPTANITSQTDPDVQGNLLREYEQKFAELPEQQN